jgi:SRSO17 transposase
VAAREQARIPAGITFHDEKWRQALTLLRQVRAAGLHETGVLADAKFGDNSLFWAMLHRLQLTYAVGISASLTVFLGAQLLIGRRTSGRGRPRTRPELAPSVHAQRLDELATGQGPWRQITWRHRRDAHPWTVTCLAVRVTPAHDWRHRRLAPEIWLLCERDFGDTPRTKY